MQSSQLDYKIYVTLLDAYKWYASSESDESEQEFINKINRVKFESEAASKGTWFNNFLDSCLEGKEKFNLCYVNSPVKELVNDLEGAARQMFVKTIIDVDGAKVELYGYLDYLKHDIVTDVKTTKQYELGKYKDSLQLHFYPIALIDSGNEINAFEFKVFDFDQVYTERYPVNYNASKAKVVSALREIIRFIELKKDLITDKKIFANENI